MINIKDLVNESQCDFCGKAKPCCIVQFADQTQGESVLCWKCVEKQTQMKLRSRQPRATSEKPAARAAHPEPKPVDAATVDEPKPNGAAEAAVPVLPR